MPRPGLFFLAAVVLVFPAAAQSPKTFIDYFLPTPIVSPLSTTAWGATSVGPRDQKNGLEDPTMKQWDYWDGQIIHGSDGKYHIFASRWDQSFGHNAWFRSKAIHAESDSLIGPYIDKGLCWPGNQEGKGHNVTALVLPDGRYAIVVSESRPGDVFVANSLDGPWTNIGSIQLAPVAFSAQEKRMSNLSIMVRPDGAFEIVPRSWPHLDQQDRHSRPLYRRRTPCLHNHPRACSS